MMGIGVGIDIKYLVFGEHNIKCCYVCDKWKIH